MVSLEYHLYSMVYNNLCELFGITLRCCGIPVYTVIYRVVPFKAIEKYLPIP